ncbi:hypothetical protein D9615_004214 [Tricholomella constricta]|uniref:Coiled-coil domain-containing protein 16 n=1 Tax=Tricholomella constricta TaxID=117010 RepID=A0A8H5M5Y4_9AGAR|nr:hypothetical protein D9615_004214 [Tricholomella constricta]
MADVRALLKAKRQEARITHPLAAYTSSGQLRCSACGTAVKHTSAWEGHLGSKAHRTNVARLREQERLQAERARAEAEAAAQAAAEAEKQRASQVAKGKRKADDDDDDDDMDGENATDKETNDIENGAKRRRVGPAPGGFPADFFSDPSRAPIPITSDSDDDEDANAGALTANGAPPPPATTQSAIDLEYERFQREMLGNADNVPDAPREAYERATVVAEPELVTMEDVPSEFPAEDQQMDVDAEKQKQSEEELARRRKEQDERELIMDRLLDEERAQEEADQRVVVMKARLEALKKKREVKKAQESEPRLPGL